MLDITRFSQAIERIEHPTKLGRITAIHDTLVEASGCDVLQGELVEIIQAKGAGTLIAEVVGLRDKSILLMPFGSSMGLCLNSRVLPLNKFLTVPVSEKLLGRVIDPIGTPLDSTNTPLQSDQRNTHTAPINPLDRVPIKENLETGIRALDIFCPFGKGQRLGIFAGSGVGKSTLLGMIAKNASADVVVIALVGERGREVLDFIEDSLGSDGLKKSVVVVATAEQPALFRKQAAFTATSIAEWFRDQNKHVLLIMDSVTRLAMAQREIGLSTGEPIGTRGYPSSAFSLLPPLLERAGTKKGAGSITAIYTVLVEGDDMNEPITDHMRSLLDGHIVLTRELANKAHYPAIDILQSVSRLTNRLLDSKKQNIADKIRKLLATYSSAKDMIEIGAYEKGTSAELDQAIELKLEIDRLLTQSSKDKIAAGDAWRQMDRIFHKMKHIAG